MKLPNGYGSVVKLSGHRRKPYMVRITTGFRYDEEKEDYLQVREVLGYYEKKSEALAALSDYNKNAYSLTDSKLTVGELWNMVKDDSHVSHARNKKLQATFNNHCSSIKDMRIKDVKTRHLQQTIDQCPTESPKLEIKTIYKRIFTYATQNDYIQKNYADYIKASMPNTKIKRNPYTKPEIDFVWKNIDDEYFAVTIILLHQGMRIKELLDLTLDRIDLKNNTITIDQAKNKYSIRTIPINHAVLDVIKCFYNNSADNKLFHITYAMYKRHIDSLFNHHPYDARHTFATKCNELNISKLSTQRIMGHKPDSILEETYTHITIEELQKSIDNVFY